MTKKTERGVAPFGLFSGFLCLSLADIFREKMKNIGYFTDLYILCIDILSVSSYHKNAMLFIQYGGLGAPVFLTDYTTDKEPKL